MKFRIYDELSGIKSYEGRINNNWILFEYDNKNDVIISKKKNSIQSKKLQEQKLIPNKKLVFDKIEKSLFDRVGTGVFLSLFISFMFTVIFQSYVSDYKLSFFGFTIALMLVSVGLYITIKLKDALETNEKN